MHKKIIIAVCVVLVLGVAYWLVSPLWKKTVLNESFPTTSSAVIKDEFETMDAETKAELEEQTDEMKEDQMVEDETMPSNEPTVIGEAELIARAHDVEGSALFVKSGTETVLRFEDLKTINGPDLRIYLASSLSDDDIVDLGVIRATEGNVNYAIPAGTDLEKYSYVMIWCRAFSVLFSYAHITN